MNAEFLRAWLPPALRGALARATGLSVRFAGSPVNWQQAQSQSHGYATPEIIERVINSTREVVAGRAAFERDSVTFEKWMPPFQIIAPLLRHALENNGRLNVADFGGSLGSSYRACKPFFPSELLVRWCVIEQPQFVEAGRAEFSTDNLSFYDRIEELPSTDAPYLLLASGVLQYIENTSQCLASWGALDANTLVLDRTPISNLEQNSLTIQRVPRQIYNASYPMWILSRSQLAENLKSQWTLLCEYDCPEGRHVSSEGVPFEFKGMVFSRRPK